MAHFPAEAPKKQNPALFSPSFRNKKIHPERISYTSRNGNPKTETLKSFFYFKR